MQKDDFVMPIDSIWKMDNIEHALDKTMTPNLNGKVLLSFE